MRLDLNKKIEQNLCILNLAVAGNIKNLLNNIVTVTVQIPIMLYLMCYFHCCKQKCTVYVCIYLVYVLFCCFSINSVILFAGKGSEKPFSFGKGKGCTWSLSVGLSIPLICSAGNDVYGEKIFSM